LSAFLLNDIPWFLTEGKLAAIFIKTFSWVFQLAGHLLHQQTHYHHRAINKFSGAIAGDETPTSTIFSPVNSAPSSFLVPLPGKSGRPLQGEFFARTSFTLF
jgi:hypothetical protein